MAGQLRLYSQNNLRRNLAGPTYPDRIVLRGRDLDFFARISPLIETLKESSDKEDELVLEHDLFYRGIKWPLIVDLLFPYELSEERMPSHELFYFRDNGNPYLNPNRDVTMAELREIIDYFMIGHPQEMEEILLKFAYMRPGAPPRPPRAEFTIPPAQEIREERAAIQRLRTIPRGNNNYPENNENNDWSNNTENQGPNIGYTEEEEGLLGKLKGTNAKRYTRGGKRRGKKLKRKTRKH